MQNPSNTADQLAGSPRQWQTQPATGDVIGGCELSTLGALLLSAERGEQGCPSAYFAGVRADYLRDGSEARFRVITTHGSPMTEMVPACELRVPLPLGDVGEVARFLEESVRRMVPEVEFVKRTERDRSRRDAAEALAAEGRARWEGLTRPE